MDPRTLSSLAGPSPETFTAEQVEKFPTGLEPNTSSMRLVHSGSELGFRLPVLPGAVRTMVPNAEGEYHGLDPALEYWECVLSVRLLEELPPPPASATVGTQVDWQELPVPPERHMMRFLPPQ